MLFRMIFKKKFLLLILFLIIIFQTLLYTNNNQKTSFRFFEWTAQNVSIGKLISISFFSGLFVSTLLNITTTSINKKSTENIEDDNEALNNDEYINPNIEMPPQRDIRDAQPTISVNYRVVKNTAENNSKRDQNYSNNNENEDDWINNNNDW
jgi:uncharacterized integral membrane protein